jgi:hypothetical protein
MNCVECTIVNGSCAARISSSCATLARK